MRSCGPRRATGRKNNRAAGQLSLKSQDELRQLQLEIARPPATTWLAPQASQILRPRRTRKTCGRRRRESSTRKSAARNLFKHESNSDPFGLSKRSSEFFDPCQDFANASIKCMQRNNGDKDMCQDYFQCVFPEVDSKILSATR